MDKRLYMRHWQMALDRFELSLRSKMARERNRFIKEAAASFADGVGHTPSHIVIKHAANVKAVLYTHYQSVMPYFGKLATTELKARNKFIEQKADRSRFYTMLIDWAATRALNSSTSIAATNMDDVTAAIVDGLENGLGTAEIARSIRNITGLTPYRAATIARTETNTAATFGAIEEARQTSEEIGIVLVKEWLPTADERTRPSHLSAAGQRVGLDAQFEIGGEYLDRPCDPSGSPENVINCRCAIITEEADF